jgi:hypothetical protein
MISSTGKTPESFAALAETLTVQNGYSIALYRTNIKKALANAESNVYKRRSPDHNTPSTRTMSSQGYVSQSRLHVLPNLVVSLLLLAIGACSKYSISSQRSPASMPQR